MKRIIIALAVLCFVLAIAFGCFVCFNRIFWKETSGFLEGTPVVLSLEGLIGLAMIVAVILWFLSGGPQRYDRQAGHERRFRPIADERTHPHRYYSMGSADFEPMEGRDFLFR